MQSNLDHSTLAGGHMKGALLRELLAFATQQRAVVAMHEAVRQLPDVWRQQFDESDLSLGVVVSTWYPVAAVHRLLDAATHGLSGAARTEFARIAARAAMRGMLQGVYRTLFSMMATPERYARHGQRLWASTYDTGRWSGVLAEGTLQAQVRFWSGHHPFLCELNTHCAIPLFEAMGQRNVLVSHDACVGRGDATCRYVVSWT